VIIDGAKMSVALPSVNVIILNWNGFEDSLKSINSSVNQSYKNCSITVVDNGSSDDSLVRLEQYNNGRFFLISSKDNRGFAGGVNMGLRRSIERNYRYCLLLNNDAVLLPDAVQNFVDYMEERPDIGISGGIVLNMEDDDIQVNGGRNVNYITGRCSGRKRKPDFISGALMMIRTSALNDIGLFSEDYFMYWEDVDFSLRARKEGWKIGVCHRAIARHKAMASTKNNSANYDYHFTRSSVIFFYRFGWNWLWAFPVLNVAFKKIIKRSVELKKKNVMAVLSAVKDGVNTVRLAK